jgi:hypothetical protein
MKIYFLEEISDPKRNTIIWYIFLDTTQKQSFYERKPNNKN